MKIERLFSTEGKHPYEEVKWIKKNIVIKNAKDEIIFEQKDVEYPDFWSDNAIQVVASKYFYGQIGTPERESSIKQLIDRVVNTYKAWSIKSKVFTKIDANIFTDELIYLLIHQYGCFNSPVWFNVGNNNSINSTGFYLNEDGKIDKAKDASAPSTAACFIQSIKDDMEDILEHVKREGNLFKWGSGSGTNYSTLRSSKEKITGGGICSGPISFMKIFDSAAGVIKSGGKTRRAAKLDALNITHPDIIEFINCKTKQEKLAEALIDAGFDGSMEGEVYSTVRFQNSNLSVRVDDNFMKLAEEKKTYFTKNVRDNSNCSELNADNVLSEISNAIWESADPGIQFDTIVNEFNTCKNSGRINASNPCGEYIFLDNTSCNLASLNLTKFISNKGFEIKKFIDTIRIFVICMDLNITYSSYPTKRICEQTQKFRTLGLGYSNLGAMLMQLAIPYVDGRYLAASITSLMTAAAYMISAEIAVEFGPFAEYDKNKDCMNEILYKHFQATKEMAKGTTSYINEKDIFQSAETLWDGLLQKNQLGYRNAQTTAIAPTGTISYFMDCDTFGIEPDYSLVKHKKLSGGGIMKIINNSIRAALKKLNYTSTDIKSIIDYLIENETFKGSTVLKYEHFPIFACAVGDNTIRPDSHIKMMASVQPFISGGISKTVNLSSCIKKEEIKRLIFVSWTSGLKGITFFREGSKIAPLSDVNHPKRAPKRYRLPADREARTHAFTMGEHKGYITTGYYSDGAIGELFITINKEGDSTAGWANIAGKLISVLLQYGVPCEEIVKSLKYTSFPPNGFTNNPKIKKAESVIDYAVKHMELTENINIKKEKIEGFKMKYDRCPRCGNPELQNPSCPVCTCGWNAGCSQ